MKGVSLKRGVFWFRGRIRGELKQFSLGTSDEIEAIEKARDYLAALELPVEKDDGSFIPPDEARRFQRAIDSFLTYKRALHNTVNHLRMQRVIIEGAVTAMNWTDPSAVTQKQVEAWSLTKDNPRTRMQYLEILSRFFRWLVEKGRISRNPCDGIERPRKIPKAVRKRFLTPDEATKLLETPYTEPYVLGSAEKHEKVVRERGEALRFAMFAALHAGLRKGEVLAARPEWFDLERGLLHVTAEAEWHAKNGDDRAVPLSKPFIAFLKDYGLRKPYMFRPGKLKGKNYNRAEFTKSFTSHARRCGITDVVFHDLRRTFASLHVSAGTSIYLVAKWCGDGVAVIEKHYGHLVHTGDDINRAWSKPKKPRKPAIT